MGQFDRPGSAAEREAYQQAVAELKATGEALERARDVPDPTAFEWSIWHTLAALILIALLIAGRVLSAPT